MTVKKTAKPETSDPLPQSGGAWIRKADGSLIRDPGEEQHDPEAQPEADTAPAPTPVAAQEG